MLLKESERPGRGRHMLDARCGHSEQCTCTSISDDWILLNATYHHLSTKQRTLMPTSGPCAAGCGCAAAAAPSAGSEAKPAHWRCAVAAARKPASKAGAAAKGCRERNSGEFWAASNMLPDVCQVC